MAVLYTSGCSFTRHSWPTWADYLGYFFDDYYNLGGSAAGNEYIFKKIIDISPNITQEDTVVVQFSGLGRVSRYQQNELRYNGDIYDVSDLYDDMYRDNYFSFEKEVYNFNLYVQVLIELFNRIGCKYKLIFMMNPMYNNFEYMGEPLAVNFNSKSRRRNIKKFLNNNGLVKEFKNTINYFFNKTSIWEYQSLNEAESEMNNWIHNLDDEQIGTDYHPISKTHYGYVRDVLANDLNITITEEDNIKLENKANDWDSKFKTSNRFELYDNWSKYYNNHLFIKNSIYGY